MKGKYETEYKRIYDFLRKDKKEPTLHDVKEVLLHEQYTSNYMAFPYSFYVP